MNIGDNVTIVSGEDKGRFGHIDRFLPNGKIRVKLYEGFSDYEKEELRMGWFNVL